MVHISYVGSKQVIIMHPDSLWAGSQLAMTVQEMSGACL